ncbi:acyltransferase [Candidatus Pelagibacter sp. HIMB1587]|uniref:acyltransferase n=1 Tax=Candidatus Pelagibacter sp. HIMB1587 TaxID=3413354 RepID=UPI003F87420C
MHFFKRVFCFIGNYLPPKLNSFFYKIAGVRFNFKKVWIGNKCYLDKNYPENIIIKDNVCISSQVTIFTHFDPSRIKENYPIKKYKKEVVIEEDVFVGPRSVIMPGVIIRKNTFIRAGSVITKSTNPNTIVCGNPQTEEGYLSGKLVKKINSINKKYFF